MKKGKQPLKRRKPNKVLRTAVLEFIADVNAARFSRNLRKLLLDYISQNKDYLPIDFEIYLNDFANLFELLDKMDDEHL